MAFIRLSNVNKILFKNIYLDSMYIHIGNSKIEITKAGLYNQIYSYLTIKKIHNQFIEWLKLEYKTDEISSQVKSNYERRLRYNQRNTIYSEVLRIKRNDNNTIDFYVCLKNNQVSFLTNNNNPTFYNTIIHYLQFNQDCNLLCDKLKIDKPLLKSNHEIKQDIKEALANGFISEIKDVAILSNNPDNYSIGYYDLNIGNHLNKTPAWDNFIRQIKDEDARSCFMAWIYSVFFGDNHGRQLLYLYGKGNTGKSVVAKAISNRLLSINDTLCTELEQTLYMDKFSSASYVKKRLIVAPDCTDRKILDNTLIKNITGNDKVSIRKIGKDKISENVYSKVLITSNYLPWCDLEKPEHLSRLLLISLDEYLSNEAFSYWNSSKMGLWEDELQYEIDDFITKCKPHYEAKLLNNGHDLKTYKDMPLYVENRLEELSINLNNWFKYCLIEDNSAGYLLYEDLAEDFIRFLHDSRRKKMHSFLTHKYLKTFLINEKNLEFYDVGMGKNVAINGYRFKTTDKTTRATIRSVLNYHMSNVNSGKIEAKLITKKD